MPTEEEWAELDKKVQAWDRWMTNRVRKTEPSPKRAAWCDRCDRNLIRPGEKCSVCGFRDTETKHSKP